MNWEELVVAHSRSCLGLAWTERGKLLKISIGIAGVPTGVQTEYLPNTGLDRYRYTTLLC
jgi:hypothetical protein